MFKFSHRALIIVAGIFWLIVGFFLLSIGLKLVVGVAKAHALTLPSSGVILPYLSQHLGDIETAAVLLIAASLGIGYVKSRFVLMKSVKRVVRRILTLPNPASLSRIYHIGYYLLIGAMIGLGVLLKAFKLPHDIRGAIDIAIGGALLNGSLLYFRYAANLKRENLSL